MSVSEQDSQNQDLLTNSSPADYGTAKQNVSDTTAYRESKERPAVDTGCTGARGWLVKSIPNEEQEIVYLVLYIFLLFFAMGNAIRELIVLPAKSPEFALALVLVVNAVFSFKYALFGLRAKRGLEILAATVSSVLVVVYVIVDFTFTKHTWYKLWRMIVVCIFGPVIIGLGGYVAAKYRPNGVSVRQHIQRTAAMAWKRPLTQEFLWYLFGDLIWFNLQLSWNLVILSLTSRHNVDTEEITEMSLWIPFAFLLFVLGMYAEKKRKLRALKIYCALTGIVESCYIIYRAVRVIITEHEPKYRYLEISTYVCGGLAIAILQCILIITGLIHGYSSEATGRGTRQFQNQTQPANLASSSTTDTMQTTTSRL